MQKKKQFKIICKKLLTNIKEQCNILSVKKITNKTVSEGEQIMKEFKIKYEWNGKTFAEPVMGKNLIDATATFVKQLYADTNSWERCKAGFKLCM